MSEKTINATIKVVLKPWDAPNFARRDHVGDGSENAIHVSELDENALEDMALAWLDELYRKAKRTSPFDKPAKASRP